MFDTKVGAGTLISVLFHCLLFSNALLWVPARMTAFRNAVAHKTVESQGLNSQQSKIQPC